jgi:anti-sigma B factor antagonist
VSTGVLDPIRLEGDLTVQVAAEYKILLLNALADGDEITLDLSGINELDTAGLQLLLLLKREAGQLGRTVRFTEPSPAVLEVLALARLDLALVPISTSGEPLTDQAGGS